MKTILVAVDYSDVTDRVVAKAGELAKGLGAKVWVMHAVTDTSYIGGMGDVAVPWSVPDSELPRHFPSEMGRLRDMTAMLRDMGVDAEHLLVSGPAIQSIMEMASEKDADLIIMGSHGHGALYELLVGTVGEGVLRRTERPVLIVPSIASKAHAESHRNWSGQVPVATPY